ncbi:DUF6777 domain-containing protein [Streptomyces hiroshimensis]|uniref:DUF6777 domain-containing protein n=1 Tax=Streptomyces hiroshimensis TaxID=66424 RepID=UPI0016792441|nr:DUF6777 domain-containing protein [Streptomyces hiroshimensis]
MSNPFRAVALFTVPALIGVASLAGCGSSGGGKAVQLVLEAVGEVGAFPFLEHPDTDLRGVVSASPGGGEWQGDARGAFGGVQGTTRCDKASLIKQITEDPEKARAWAAVKEIDEGRIGEYINKLTETYLEFDTLVKNHDYRDGEAAEYMSVLQKGVLVLVDEYASPAVKCNCGNPLEEPDREVDLKAASYTGTRWKSFAATEVTVIKPRTKEQGPVKQLPLVDPFQGDKAFDRSVGSDGSKDTKTFRWDPPKTRPTTGAGVSPATGGTSGSSGGQSKPSSPPAGSPSSGSSAAGSSADRSEEPSGRVSAQGVPSSESPTGASAGASTGASTGTGGPSQSRKPGSATPGTGRPTPSRTKAPVPAPTTSRPIAPQPTTPKPVTPTATKPVAPASPKPVTPTAVKPVTPTAVHPATPTAAKPTAATGVHPVTPTAAKPAVPTAPKPAVPTAAKPDAPTHHPPATGQQPPPATHAPAPHPS